MSNLTFQTTRSVVVEPGASRRLGQLMVDLGCQRVLLVTDPGIRDLGLHQAALEGCGEAGVEVELFADVVADPPEAVILEAVESARTLRIDGVIGLGGGSSLDVAKLIAYLLGGTLPLSEIYGIDQCRGQRLPLALAPTTAGTGSEVTPIAIVTTGASEKKGVVDRQLLPDWAVLDADLTLGLPRHITAATGVDAMVHAIEAYTSKVRKNRISDCLAREALVLLGGNIRTVCEDGGNRQARSDMLLGSLLAGMAFSNAPVAAVHALAYPLGGHFHVAHGLSNALVLPHVLCFNAAEAGADYAELAPLVFPKLAEVPAAERSTPFIDALAALNLDLGLETRLREVGVTAGDLDLLADDAMKQTRLLVNNPREVSRDDAYAIYERAL